ncbi:hypothetical protein [Xanthovirga aplysinae]|uniref:hypothetical protein n=1 Tax=Xanthovirga aplysinae TaxID=2529853 RepID=UPI0012BD72BC|nr:hypothetical protein [Xanthovirga aplysinae]MTI33315.1 hypothetical protein [Xanthovirga aplysinae]
MFKTKKYNFGPLLPSDDFAHLLEEKIGTISTRIEEYNRQEMRRTVRVVGAKELLKLEVFKHDPDRFDLSRMMEVREVGPSLETDGELEQARQYFRKKGKTPVEWEPYLEMGTHPPFFFEKTSFLNLFSKNTLAMIDIYRPPWKNYFTSDAFFSQWLKALGRKMDIMNFPYSFPKALYIHNIIHTVSRKVLDKIFDDQDKDHVQFSAQDCFYWEEIMGTPHLKCVNHILSTYNKVNVYKGSKAHHIKAMQLYRNGEMYHLKLLIEAQSRIC